MGISGKVAGQANDLRGLLYLAKFRWLRAQELGGLMWPTSQNATKNAERLVRKWEAAGLVLCRPLPDHNGRAVVLATGGVRLLNKHNHQAQSGKDWGETDGRDTFAPPREWRHDLMATGVLVQLAKNGWGVIPEHEIRRLDEGAQKIPDGIAYKNGEVWWIELERSKKRGKHLAHVAANLIRAATGAAEPVAGYKATRAVVAYSVGATDERGYAIDHRGAIENAIARCTPGDVPVLFLSLVQVGAGVVGYSANEKTLESIRTGQTLARMTAQGWRKNELEAVWCCDYDGYLCDYFESQAGSGWDWEISRNGAKLREAVKCVPTITQAKQQIAAAIAHLGVRHAPAG